MGSALPGLSRNSSEFHGTCCMKGWAALDNLAAAFSMAVALLPDPSADITTRGWP